MSTTSARSSTGSGVSDGALVGVLAALLGGCLILWTSVEVAGLVQHGTWPHVSLADTAHALPRLVHRPHDFAGAWPDRAGIPSLGVLTTVFFVELVVVLALAVFALRLRNRRRGHPGWASRTDIDRHLSARAVQRKARLIRPSITARRPDPRTVGVHLGRDVHTQQQVYGSLEDSYVIVGPPRSGKGIHLVIPALRDTPGAAIVPSTKPDTLGATIRQRQQHGPVYVFDPQGLSDWPTRLRWAPERGCDDPLTAILRARALAAGARSNVGLENGDFWTGMTQAVVRCYLHAAALDGRPIRHVLRWAGNPTDPEPQRILRQASGTAEGWSEELEEQASADQRQRGSVWAGVRRAFDSLADPHVLDACSPSSHEAFDAEAFLRERGTLYLLGSSGAQLSIAPLVTALIEDIVEAGRRLAAHSPGGRLDPPLLLLLDEVANIAPLPSLPSLLSDGGGVGIPTVAVLQSLAQARARWGEAEADAMWDASTIKVILGGLSKVRDLTEVSGLAGEIDEPVRTLSRGAGGSSATLAQRKTPVLQVRDVRNLQPGTALVMHRATAPALLALDGSMPFSRACHQADKGLS